MYEKALHELDTYLEVHSYACPTLATVVENQLEDTAYVTTSETSFTSINERRYRYVNSWMYALSTFRVYIKRN